MYHVVMQSETSSTTTSQPGRVALAGRLHRLFATWAAEDETNDAEERTRREVAWNDVQVALDEARHSTRRLFPDSPRSKAGDGA